MAIQAFRSMNASMRAAIEATSGTEQSASAAGAAIRTRGNPSYSIDMQMADEGYAQESVSAAQFIPGAVRAAMRVPTWLTASNAPGTTPPDWTLLLRICGYSETLTSAAVTGTGSSFGANALTLDGASTTAQIYRGMPLDITGYGRRWISNYTTGRVATFYPAVTSPTGTPAYSIPANALYQPITQGQKTATLYAYQHDSVAGNTSRLMKVLGAMGNYAMGFTTGGFTSMDFQLEGQFPAAPTDVTAPAAATPAGFRAPVFSVGANASIDNAIIQMASASISSGNTLGRFPDPAAAYGVDSSEIVARRVTGSVQVSDVHISARDSVTDMLAPNTKVLVLAWGNTSARRLSVLCPAIQFQAVENTNIESYAAKNLTFQATGLDSEIFICVAA